MVDPVGVLRGYNDIFYIRRLSVFISFPTVDAGTLPAGIFDSTESSGFEHLLSEIDEYTESVVFLKTRRRRRLAELSDS